MLKYNSFEKLASKDDYLSDTQTETKETKPKCLKARADAFADYFKTLKKYYGTSFLLFMFDNYVFVKGLVDRSLLEVGLPLCQSLKVGSNGLQMLELIQNIPWALKGLFGVLSDLFPLFGYHKRSHMIVFGILSSVFAIFLTVSSIHNLKLLQDNFWLVILSYWMIALTPSAYDLLCEGKYTEIMIKFPETKAGIISYVWFWQSVGGLLISSYMGPVTQRYGPYPILASITFFVIQIAIAASFNMIRDEPVPKEKANKIDFVKAKEMGVFVGLAICTGICLVVASVITLSQPILVQLCYLWGIGIFIIILEYILLPTALANANLYMFVTTAAIPRISGATQYWYTAGPSCVPDGPHFDLVYYKTVTNLISYVATIAATIFFQLFMSQWPYRRVQLVAGIANVIAFSNDYIILNRWNITYLGISDYAMYTVGDAIVQPMVSMLIFLPGFVLISRICPRTIESTVYAIFAGFSNFGNAVASATGMFLLQQTGTEINGESNICNYDSLPTLVLICNVVCVAAFLPTAFLLLPAKKMSEPLSEEELSLQNSLLQKRLKATKKLVAESKASNDTDISNDTAV